MKRIILLVFGLLIAGILLLSVETRELTDPQGNCLLKVIAGNEPAKTATVYLNDEEIGTLERGELTIFDLSTGEHVLVLDGGKIKRFERNVVLTYDYEAKEVTVEAEMADRLLRIITDPSGARIWVDGEEWDSRSPWQRVVEVGRTYEAYLLIEEYGDISKLLEIPEKGPVFIANIGIPPAALPEVPSAVYPADNARDIQYGPLTLEWECEDPDLLFVVEFEGQATTTRDTSLEVFADKKGRTYTWKVTAINEFNKESKTPTFTFVTRDNTPPIEPHSPSPADGARGIAEPIILEWVCIDPDGDSLLYDIYLDTLPSPSLFKSNIESSSLIVPSESISLLVEDIVEGEIYYWKVIAKDAFGGVSEGPVWTFRINLPPDKPHSPIPPDGEIVPKDIETFGWKCADPDGDPLSYLVQFGVHDYFPLLETITSETKARIDPGFREEGETILWRVVADDGKGGLTEGEVWSFVVNTSPVVPHSPVPARGEIGLPVDTVLEWKCFDPDGDTLTYDIYFGTSRDPEIVERNLSYSSYDPGRLEAETTYFWRVIAKDHRGGVTEGPLWTFRVNIPPEIPHSPSPLDNSVVLVKDTELYWECIDPDGDDLSYDIYFGTSSNPPLAESGITDNSYSPEEMEEGQSYYWRVIARDGKGGVSEGPEWKFWMNTTPVISIPDGEVDEGKVLELDLTDYGEDPDGDDITFSLVSGVGEIVGSTYMYAPDFEAAGSHDVVIQVTDVHGVSATDKFTIIVIDVNRPPEISTPDSEVYEGQLLELDLSEYAEDPDGDDITFSLVSGVGQIVGSTYMYAPDFEAAGSHDVVIQVTDVYGSSATDKFTIIVIDVNRPPVEPHSPSPEDSAVLLSTDVLLNWECIDPDGDDLSYDVYFGTSSNPPLAESGITDNSYSPEEMEEGQSYYWRVIARDGKGGVSEGPEWSFWINAPPIAPYSSVPSHNAEYVPLDIILSWKCIDPDDDPLTYDIYFGTSVVPLLAAAYHPSTSYVPSDLEEGQTYYWRVVARDDKGRETRGPLWRFRTFSETSIVPQMVLVEGGTFMMGDEHGDLSDPSRPVHQVTLTYHFEIGKYHVTFSEYDKFCDDTRRSKPSDWQWGRGERPVTNVSWWDAVEYCNWLNEEEGLPRAYDEYGNLLDKDGRVTFDPSKVIGYRLPTEAEWEYAARGGKHHSPFKYSGSDNSDEVAWHEVNADSKTQEVGRKKPNELGIFDMSGNVWEWCSDWYDKGYYSKSPSENPYNFSPSTSRVFRGGSWFHDADWTRVASRASRRPSNVNRDQGFRIVRTVH